MYLRLKDKTEVMEKCGDAALILYEFYISKSGVPEYAFTDESAAKALNWNIHKVKRNRLSLIKNNYFKQVNGTLNDGRKVTVTYLEPEYIEHINSFDKKEEIVELLEKHITANGGNCNESN